MRKMILSVCLSLVALAGTPSCAGDPAIQLNGTWEYVAAIEADRITTYDESSAIQLVILDNTWALFKDGRLIQGTVENVEYNKQTSPVSFVRRKGKAPHIVGHSIVKLYDDHLMYTTTPMDATGLGSTSGAVGNYESDPDGGGANVTAPLGGTNGGVGRPYQHPPKSFSPEGTSNDQYILRRINDSTAMMSQITNGLHGSRASRVLTDQTSPCPPP
ncbi:hypothetical protein [Aureliella helgolandensis]|nr:hypothetical protein [Aureliella helgolandensis]